MKNISSTIVNSLMEDDYEKTTNWDKPQPTDEEEPANNMEWVRADNIKSDKEQNEILKEILLELKSQNKRIRSIKDNVQFFFWIFFLPMILPLIFIALVLYGVLPDPFK